MNEQEESGNFGFKRTHRRPSTTSRVAAAAIVGCLMALILTGTVVAIVKLISLI